MMENNEGIPSQVDGRRTSKKTRRKPLTEARKKYEEDYPALGCRLDRGTFMNFHLHAKESKMSVKDYLTKLINDDHKYIEKIKTESYTAGKQSQQSEIDESFNRGVQAGAAQDAERIRSQTRRELEEDYAIFFKCANHVYGCNGKLPIKRGSQEHLIASEAIEYQNRLICPSCQYNEIMQKYANAEARSPVKPSWWPLGYK